MEKGKLKIFFGYSAGVGKTYAMLKAAQEAKQEGVDVVVGYLEPHDRPETLKMAEGLERLPLKELSYKGIDLFPIYRKYTEEHKEDGYKEAADAVCSLMNNGLEATMNHYNQKKTK